MILLEAMTFRMPAPLSHESCDRIKFEYYPHLLIQYMYGHERQGAGGTSKIARS